MIRRFGHLLVVLLVTLSLVPVLASPAQACEGEACIVNCVNEVVANGVDFYCRL